MTSQKCTKCGSVPREVSSRACDVCGHVTFGDLVLRCDATGRHSRMSVGTQFGKTLLRSFAGDEAAYASEPQFRIFKDPSLESWAIQAVPGAVNPTWVNGSPLADAPAPLHEGATISIGPKLMKLTVHLEG